MRALQRIIKFIRLPLKEKLLMGEAVFYLLWYSFLIYIIPFRWWETKIGKKMHSISSDELDYLSWVEIEEVKKAVFRANTVLLNMGKCFAKSLTIKRLLQTSEVIVSLNLGLYKDKKNELKAHAWLNYGKVAIYGNGKNSLNYKSLLVYH